MTRRCLSTCYSLLPLLLWTLTLSLPMHAQQRYTIRAVPGGAAAVNNMAQMVGGALFSYPDGNGAYHSQLVGDGVSLPPPMAFGLSNPRGSAFGLVTGVAQFQTP